MNSTGSISNSQDFVASGVFTETQGGSGRPSTSCTKDKHMPSSGQSFLTHSDHSATASPGDLAFAQKCADLQKYNRPLLELLYGLKRGRFDKGLTSFQQSVAIDRLQRILGILQKPDMGERYLRNLLQIEVMLKAWFPLERAKSNQINAMKRTQYWCQNQLHIPAKKRKMSWLDPDRSGALSTKHKQLKQEKYAICDVVTCLPGFDKQSSQTARTNRQLEPNGHEFMNSSNVEAKEMHGGISLHAPVTQDSSVSSSTTTADSP
ncbi:circadian associated repressor of transcription a [Eucyclogobius newberryi]|uniref:circadian associated repressor of transcription a n=1 Tax=Eucyclogobius newberryi TaxID=166745 RepID=UPI003B58F805